MNELPWCRPADASNAPLSALLGCSPTSKALGNVPPLSKRAERVHQTSKPLVLLAIRVQTDAAGESGARHASLS